MAISFHTIGDDQCGNAILGQREPIRFLKQTFQAHQYDCAVAFAKDYGLRISLLPGRDGIDTRFAFREAATELAAGQQYVAERRRALVKASAWTSNSPNPTVAPKEEVHADVRMLLTAADRFLTEDFRKIGALARQEETVKRDSLANWIDVLLAAIALDRRLPDAQPVDLGYTGPSFNWRCSPKVTRYCREFALISPVLLISTALHGKRRHQKNLFLNAARKF